MNHARLHIHKQDVIAAVREAPMRRWFGWWKPAVIGYPDASSLRDAKARAAISIGR
jgi:hypothetical protein